MDAAALPFFRHPMLKPGPLALYAAIAALVGVGIALLMGGGRDVSAPRMITGAMIGFSAFSLGMTSEVLLFRSFSRLSERNQYLARAVMFTFAGFGGVYIGLLLSSLIFGGARLPRLHWTFLLTVMIGAGIGMIMFTVEHLRSKLADSIERLKEKEYAEKELALARDIQKRLLPATDLEAEGYRIAARNEAARWVAGDFYDVFALPDGRVGVVVADVAGKGMGASLIMASVKAVLPLLAAGRSVEATMQALNEKLASELGRREFVALAFARFDPATGVLRYANAGLPDPYLLSGAGATELTVPGPRLPLGVRRLVAYETGEVRLERGDAVVFLSDGLPEAPGAGGEPLGYPWLASALARREGTTPAAWVDELFASVRAASPQAAEDDWTVLILERT